MFSYEILQSYDDLEMMVYNYVLEHKEEVKYMTIRGLAEAVHVSTSTIIRFCKKTGCEGYSEFKVQFTSSMSFGNNRKAAVITP